MGSGVPPRVQAEPLLLEDVALLPLVPGLGAVLPAVPEASDLPDWALSALVPVPLSPVESLFLSLLPDSLLFGSSPARLRLPSCLKSVSYQPLPFSLNAAADTSFLSAS